MVAKYIAEIPSRIWAEGRPPKVRAWETQFNVASWVRISGATGDVGLEIRWRDERGDQSVRVDRTEAGGDGSVLLSGMVQLRFSGKVENVNAVLTLGSPSMRFVVDELFMQRRGAQQTVQNKLISNF